MIFEGTRLAPSERCDPVLYHEEGHAMCVVINRKSVFIEGDAPQGAFSPFMGLRLRAAAVRDDERGRLCAPPPE